MVRRAQLPFIAYGWI